ncbi:hypothetical protein COU87_03795 [Candidatus Roizmanbacteria bacterium CG10_big_fil_rev_8_21_14_0_10_39_12]|uniref:Uncharacterized protein n=1 Tax=Candidatus Roizmanbacteria bacterium CG10_big_fil_rev_8_21_14_0_10_39_12 TaxID=1974852 RepID=A0A2M8KNT4_9BACT|nr:MAG: hypothetical protein COU87_03795 [Candidatus Roizmanbacteria bacterium CG10_big_fil_rev_8_21_14_0_10_39_12]
MHRIIYLFKTTTEEFVHDNATQMAAALAYYALFAFPSILLISINILSIFLEDIDVQTTLIGQAQRITGGSTSEILRLMVDHLHQYSELGNTAQWIGIIVLIIAASGALGHLQVSLNTIWNIAPHPSRSFLMTLRRRFVATFFIGAIGILVLAAFIFNTLINKVGFQISGLVGLSPFFLQSMNILISFVGITVFITLIYKLIPEGDMAWKDIFIGALVSAFLFILGKYVIGLIMTNNSFSTIYGAAGSLLILLIWVYYLSLIFFFGAEFTQVYSHLYGKGVALRKGTVSVKDRILLKKNGEEFKARK